MRRFGTAVLLAGAVLLASVGVASASSHGAMPAGLSFTDMVVWEVQHYAIHMQLTAQAIQTWFVSPQLGWDLLDGQSLCSSQGRLTELLFDTGTHALESFFSTIIVLAWIGIEIAARILAFLANLARRPTQAHA